MKVSQASKIWTDYHRAYSKHNTVRAYKFTIEKFNQNFANLNLTEVSTDDILDFMNQITEGRKPQTKRIRFSHLTAFFNTEIYLGKVSDTEAIRWIENLYA